MQPDRSPTLLLSAADVRSLLDLKECIAAVEEGFRLLGEGKLPPPQILALHAPEGGLHIKAALWRGDHDYFVAKANANLPGNPSRYGLPTIQGVIIIADARTGEFLALLDSIEITAQRTAAASAVAAKYLARKDSSRLALFGCGRQGLMHVHAIAHVVPIREVHFVEPNDATAQRFIQTLAKDSRLRLQRHASASSAVAEADVIATCTPARQFFIRAADVRPGTFIAAVGADSEHKQEIDPALFPNARVVVDSLDQCATIGDLHHAIVAGTATRESVYADLGAVVAKTKSGRTTDSEITLFDSTGIAIQDAATALYVLDKARSRGRTATFAF
jgi:ornithine cyclodeaminase/alanine dehydrogenase-like protein (mu-crystallin family)